MSPGDGPRRIFRLPLRRNRIGKYVDEELATHLSLKEDELVQEGWSREDARREALRQFGDVESVRRECRRIDRKREGRMRIVDVVDALRQDAVFAVRQFRRSPGAGLLAMLTLALGIGAATVVFSVVNAVVLAPFPFPDPDRLVLLQEVTPQGEDFSLSEPNYLDWADRQRAFDEIAGFSFGDRTLSAEGEAVQLSGTRVTHGFFRVTGLELPLGRAFLADEDRPNAPRVVVLSEGFWTERFGSDPDVLQRSLLLDGEPHQVVGVAASDQAWPGTEIFTPLAPDPAAARDNHLLNGLGRLGDGVTLEAARGDVARIAAELAQEYPDANAGWGGTITTLQEWRVGDRMTRLGYFLLGAVALLLVMACASVSNLLLAKATTRQREMGLRAALGAGRGRMIGQLATESVVLGVLGGGLGILVAWWATPAVRALGPGDVPRLADAGVNGTVLAVAVGLSISTVLLFGLAPALHATRGHLSRALREAGPTGASSGRTVRSLLVTGQFALAVVLLLGAGLLYKSFSRLQTVDLGFDADRILEFSLNLPPSRYDDDERLFFVAEMEARLAALPGAEAAGVGMSGPWGGFRASNFVAPADAVPDTQDDFVPVSWRSVTASYFTAAGVPLRSGRLFDPSDRPGSDEAGPIEVPVIIDEHLAEHLWPDGPAVGRAAVWEQPGGISLRVVGVVGEVRDEYVDARPRPRIYLPYAYFPWQQPTILVRTSGDPSALAPTVRAEIGALDSQLPLVGLRPLEDGLRDVVAWPRFSVQVVGAFALAALLLSCMGIYGVTAFVVNRRRRELGIRVALGADASRLVSLILRNAAQMALAGMVVGVVVAWLSSRFLESLLFEVTATDPITYLAVPLCLGLLAIVAAWLPARRAVRVDPRETLTHD